MTKAFISHSSKDKKFVRKLKEDLNENSIETWLDEDQLEVGDSLLESLEKALEESSHFIIVLSPSSVDSDWVKFELSKAIGKFSKQLMNKIIPIQYRECEIPVELKGRLYADLSREIVQVTDNKVEFTTKGYPAFFNKIVKTIKSEKKLTALDKTNLTKEIVDSETKNTSHRDRIATVFLQIVGFINNDSKNEFAERVRKETNLNSGKNIRPIILPRILKNVFQGIEIGREFILNYEFANSPQKGHFAGFRRDDIKMAIDFNIRKELQIQRTGYYVRFDCNSFSISFTKEV